MTERESMAHVQREQETPRAKSGKGKAIIKRGNAEAPSAQQETSEEAHRPPSPPSEQRTAPSRKVREQQDPQVVAKIQQRAYLLYEARGYEHGHDLEHWLEAEREITGSTNRAER